MSAYREQALIGAPIDRVWREVGDPRRYAEWAGDVAEVTGLDDVEKGARYRQRSRSPFGMSETEFVIEELDDLHEIGVRCMTSGYFLHWRLTEAGEDTFAEIEIGMDPVSMRYRVFDATIGKRWLRQEAANTLERLREVVR